MSEISKAQRWARLALTKLEASRDGQRSLLRWITYLTLTELRAVQVCLSNPPAGREKILLPDLVSNGVGGVARAVLLSKLDKAMVADTDRPLRLNKVWTMPGREPAGQIHIALSSASGSGANAARSATALSSNVSSSAAYGLPLRYAEGEEMVRGPLANDERSLSWSRSWSRRLLDAGQRLAPDGSQFNILRLHRIFSMQSAAADRHGEQTIERMLDEFVTLTVRSAFFERVNGGSAAAAGEEEEEGSGSGEAVYKGRAEVLRYLIENGFAQLARFLPDGRPRENGLQFVQPCMITTDGQTRVLLGEGPREACGASADRMRVGEQIGWSPWGLVLSITRVEKPLPTHFEWVSFFDRGNYSAVRSMVDQDCVYYCLLHHNLPVDPEGKRLIVRKLVGANDVCQRLAGVDGASEMSRQRGNISCVSAPLQGEKLLDLRKRRAILSEEDNMEMAIVGEGEPLPTHMRYRGDIALAKEAYQQCLTYGGDGDGPKRSVLHFCGRWTPVGEGTQRRGQLVVCVRETIGWKYTGRGGGASAARKIGLLVREFYIDRRLNEPRPRAPGLRPAWELHELRTGRGV